MEKSIQQRCNTEKKTKPRITSAGLYSSSNRVKKQLHSLSGSPGRTRTADRVVNSHLLYQLSYRGSQISYKSMISTSYKILYGS